MIPVVEKLKSELTDQPKAPLRGPQVQAYREERDRLASMVKAPSWQSGADRAQAAQGAKRIDRVLEEQSPKDIADPAKKDRVARLAHEVMETVIRPSMLSKAEMVRNPAGAVDAYRKREGSNQIKEAILEWRRAARALDPTNDGSDYTNIERFRPEGAVGGTSRFMGDAQIPGNFAMSPLAKENWPLGEPTADTAIKQVRARKELSPEAKDAARARLASARARLAEKHAMAEVLKAQANASAADFDTVAGPEPAEETDTP